MAIFSESNDPFVDVAQKDLQHAEQVGGLVYSSIETFEEFSEEIKKVHR